MRAFKLITLSLLVIALVALIHSALVWVFFLDPILVGNLAVAILLAGMFALIWKVFKNA